MHQVQVLMQWLRNLHAKRLEAKRLEAYMTESVLSNVENFLQRQSPESVLSKVENFYRGSRQGNAKNLLC